MRSLICCLALVASLTCGCQHGASDQGEVPRPATPAATPVAPASAGKVDATPAPLASYAEHTAMLLEAAEKGRNSLIADLIKQGADVNDKNDDGQTALHKAAVKGHKSVVVTLLPLGANVTERDARGQTPLMLAAKTGHDEIVSLLVSPDLVAKLAADSIGSLADGLNLKFDGLGDRLRISGKEAAQQSDLEGRTALMWAAANGHTACLPSLLEFSFDESKTALLEADQQGQNPLMLAAAAGHAKSIEFLLNKWGERGPPTSYVLAPKDKQDKTAIDLAHVGGHAQAEKQLWLYLALRAIDEGKVPLVKSAFEKYPEEFPATEAMQRACRRTSLATVEFLLERWKDKPADAKLELMNAVPRDTGVYSFSALQAAVWSRDPAVVKALLNRDFWPESAALVRLIQYKSAYSTAGKSIVDDDTARANSPELVKLVQETLASLQAKPNAE